MSTRGWRLRNKPLSKAITVERETAQIAAAGSAATAIEEIASELKRAKCRSDQYALEVMIRQRALRMHSAVSDSQKELLRKPVAQSELRARRLELSGVIHEAEAELQEEPLIIACGFIDVRIPSSGD